MWAVSRQGAENRAVAAIERRPRPASRILRWPAGVGGVLAILPAWIAHASWQSRQLSKHTVWLIAAGALVFFMQAWGTIAVGRFRTSALFDAHQVTVQFLGICAVFRCAVPTYGLINRVVGPGFAYPHEQRELDYSERAGAGYPEFQRDILHAEKS